MTYLIYFGLPLVCLLLAKKAEESEKKSYLMLAALLCSLVVGLRAENVGIDTPSYLSKIQQIIGGAAANNTGLEVGFVFLCKVILAIWNNPYSVLIVCSFFTNFLVFSRMWDLRNHASLPVMLICYYVQFFSVSMNVVRQMLAVAIIFYFTRYLREKKYIKFGVVVLLCTVFLHRTSLLGFLFLLFELRNWHELSPTIKKLFIGGCFALLVLLFLMRDELAFRYKNYLNNIQFNLGIWIPAKILLFVLLNSLCSYSSKPNSIQDVSYTEESIYFKYYYILGLILTMSGYFVDYMYRLGWYFVVFEGPYFGALVKNTRKNKAFVMICLVFILSVIYLLSFVNNSQGDIPYRFVEFSTLFS